MELDPSDSKAIRKAQVTLQDPALPAEFAYLKAHFKQLGPTWGSRTPGGARIVRRGFARYSPGSESTEIFCVFKDFGHTTFGVGSRGCATQADNH